VEGEVVVLSVELLKIVFVKDLLPRTRTVPEADFASRPFALKKVREMCSKRGHARTAADVYHLALGWLDMEISERTDARNNVTRLEVENIAGTYARSAVLSPGGVAMRTLKRNVRSVN